MALPPSSPPARSPVRALLHAWGPALLLIVAIGLVYAPAWSAPFYFDDLGAIVFNPSIRRLDDLHQVLAGGRYTTVVGRPLLNLSLALDYARAGLSPAAFRTTNVLLHAMAALVLYDLLRRSLRLPGTLEPGSRVPAAAWALAGAALWALHPLQTESVTYLCQRAEVLVSIFYLFSLYATLRGATDRGRPRAVWYAASVAAAFAAAASKEVAATLPVAVLLYDRAFLSGSLRAAWRQRRGLYLGLFASWLLLGWLVLTADGRADTAGWGSSVGIWRYAAGQPAFVLRYLRLALWPSELVFDYGEGAPPVAGWPWLVLLLAAAGLVWLDRRRPRLAFPLLCVPLILAPSSSIVPIATQIAAEHRMYLPLAGLAAAALAPLCGFAARATTRGRDAPWVRGTVLALAGLPVVLLGARTRARNAEYADPPRLWGSVCAARPDNVRARVEFGAALSKAGRPAEAEQQLRAAVQAAPDHAHARFYLGRLLVDSGRVAEGDPLLLTLARGPLYLGQPSSYIAIALALARHGQKDAALARLGDALRIDPADAEANYYAGCLLAQRKRWPEALARFNVALAGGEPSAEARYHRALALYHTGRPAEARAEALRAQARGANCAALLQALASNLPPAALPP